MRRVGPAPRWRAAPVPAIWTVALVALIGALALTPGQARAEFETAEEDESLPLGEFELPDWIPSIGVGSGLQAREADGSFEAYLKGDSLPSQLQPVSFGCRGSIFDLNPDRGTCDFVQDDNRTVDGTSIPGDIQLLGPAWSGDLPFGLSVRPMFRAGGAVTFGRRIVADQGFKLPDMESNGSDVDLLVELEVEPRWFWWTGLGAAIQLPFERPTFLKIGGIYHEQRYNVFNRAERGFSVNNVLQFVVREEVEEELTVRGFGPSLGLEIEVARLGPVAFSFAGDVMLTFPFSGTDTQTTFSQAPLLRDTELNNPNIELCAPGQQPALNGISANPPPPVGTGVFCWDEPDFETSLDNMFYFGGVQVRLAWVGW